MSEVGQRIKTVRKTLDLSMQRFGDRIGITRSSVNSLEKGVNKPSEQTLKLICSEFNVDYFWLTEGIGEMFTHFPETLIDQYVEEFNLDELDRTILESYTYMKPEQRQVLKNFLLSIAEKVKSEGT